MRIWVKPDQLAKLASRCPRSSRAISSRTRSIPPARSAASRCRRARSSPTRCAPRAGLSTPEEFGDIVLRANPTAPCAAQGRGADRTGRQTYNVGRPLQRQARRGHAIYQLPGSNALEAADGVKKRHGRAEEAFPDGPRLHGRARHHPARHGGHQGDRVRRCSRRMLLVILVVFVFLQNWRATLIPAAGRAGVAHRHLRRCSRCSASPSTPCRCSAWCWPSAWWWTTPSWWWRRWSTTSKKAWRPATRRSRP